MEILGPIIRNYDNLDRSPCESRFDIDLRSDQDGRLLWSDSREINWLASGAVKDLIRDLQTAINQNEPERR